MRNVKIRAINFSSKFDRLTQLKNTITDCINSDNTCKTRVLFITRNDPLEATGKDYTGYPGIKPEHTLENFCKRRSVELVVRDTSTLTPHSKDKNIRIDKQCTIVVDYRDSLERSKDISDYLEALCMDPTSRVTYVIR